MLVLECGCNSSNQQTGLDASVRIGGLQELAREVIERGEAGRRSGHEDKEDCLKKE
jgi:hypothetical protein